MKNTSIILVIAATLGLSTAANAASASTQGFYLGTNMGMSKVDFGSDSGYSSTTGFGYNLHAGYMFNQYVGAEVGYTRYANINGSQTLLGETINATFKSYSIEAAAKGVYHVQPNFAVFGKAGLASLHDQIDYSTTSTVFHHTYTTSGSNAETKVKPIIGLGAGYDATQNLTINAGWDYVIGGNGDSDVDTVPLGNMSLFYAGVDYRF